MSENPTRVNPDTGVIEEDPGPLSPWVPKTDDDNPKPTRINPDTGVVEEDPGPLSPWVPKTD